MLKVHLTLNVHLMPLIKCTPKNTFKCTFKYYILSVSYEYDTFVVLDPGEPIIEHVVRKFNRNFEKIDT